MAQVDRPITERYVFLMTNDVPKRPKQHRREDLSKRDFESALPASWTYEPKGQREYGIDGVVEIFDGDETTGLTFNVQLKGSDAAPALKAKINTTTRNYWKSFTVPTLVVLVDANDVIRYEWAHNLDTYGRKEGAASYKFTLANTWGPASAEEIEREVRAARAARQLRSHLPVYWSLELARKLDSGWARVFRTYVERALAGPSELTRRKQDAGWAAVRISVRTDAISIRLDGLPGGVIHFDAVPVDECDPKAVGADVLLGLATTLARTELDALVADLVEAAILDSSMLQRDPQLAGFAATRIADAGRADAALALVERTSLVGFGQGTDVPLVVFARDQGRLSGPAVTRIAERIADHASSQTGDAAGTYFYNAGSMLRRFDPVRALALHDLAAQRHPDYKTRGYWWRDRGRICFNNGDAAAATTDYEEADRLGDIEAVPLLADCYATAGRYRIAVETWERMRNEARFLWLAKLLSLRQLIAELGIEEQRRDVALADKMIAAGGPAEDILRGADAVHSFALWVRGRELRDEGKPALTYYFAAAAFAGGNPMLWHEAPIALQEVTDSDQHASLFGLLLLTAAQECGDRFRHYLLEDEYVSDETRERLLPVLDTLDVPDMDPFVVRFNGQAATHP